MWQQIASAWEQVKLSWQQMTMNFGFQALWSPVFIVVTALIAVLYLWAVGPGRHRFQDAEPVPLYKKCLFLFGLFLFYLGFGGPLYLVGHIMFSVHMMQMAVSFLLTPPLILLGAPSWLMKAIVLKIPFKRFFKVFSHPIPAILLFNVLFSFYHVPAIFDFLMVQKLLHNAYQTVTFAAALLMWWAIIAPVREWDQLSELKRIGLIFLDGMLLTPACALIVFANTTLYATFTDPQTWAQAMSLCLPSGQAVPPGLLNQFMWLPLLEDQRLGGVLMIVIKEVMYGSLLGYVFFQWIRKEKGEDEQEPRLEWSPE